jgi:hypothetical protein
LWTLSRIRSYRRSLANPVNNEDNSYKADILLIIAHQDDDTAIGGNLNRAIYALSQRNSD